METKVRAGRVAGQGVESLLGGSTTCQISIGKHKYFSVLSGLESLLRRLCLAISKAVWR